MEAWVIACIVFVFAALMEYTGILLQVLDDADGYNGDNILTLQTWMIRQLINNLSHEEKAKANPPTSPERRAC